MDGDREGGKQEFTCETTPVIGRSYWGAGHKACIADFYRSISRETPYQNDPASCEATMQTVLKLYAQCRAQQGNGAATAGC